MDAPTYHVITDIKEDLFNNFKKFTLNDKAHFYTYDDRFVWFYESQYDDAAIACFPLNHIMGIYIKEEEDSPWIPCTDEHAKMPNDGDEVLCTLKENWSFGKGEDVQYHVFEGMYKLTKEDCFDIPAANGKGYFEADNDWNEGQPLSVIAWMSKPEAYKE